MDMDNIRFTQSARKHHVGRTSVLVVIHGTDPIDMMLNDREVRVWIGDDERARTLEVFAVTGQRDGCCLVFHVFPTALLNKE